MNLLNLTYTGLVDSFRRTYNRGEYHAAALYRAFYGSADWCLEQLSEYANAPGFCRQLRQDLDLSRPDIIDRRFENGVSKLIFELEDGYAVETVIIPMANHFTVCISSQVGCRMGCRFCQTGRMGWFRNLRVSEIVAQVYAVKIEMGIDVRNVVFMGMGEPLDNFDAVVQAIEVMEDQRGLNIAKRRITVSTAGLPHKIQQLADLNWPQLKLALSLNASDDRVRTRLMPINQTYSMDALKTVLAAYPLARGNALFIEYVMIKGVNDQPRNARQLADYLDGLPVKLNLIPYNPPEIPSDFAAPSDDGIHRFHQVLIDQGIFVRLRGAKGVGIGAACGQLGAFKVREPSATVCASMSRKATIGI